MFGDDDDDDDYEEEEEDFVIQVVSNSTYYFKVMESRKYPSCCVEYSYNPNQASSERFADAVLLNGDDSPVLTV